jgi:hypothetical protein
MKHLKMTVAFAALLFAGRVLSTEYTFEPYVGVGYQLNQMSMKQGFGKESFKKRLNGYNLVVGAKVHDALEFEVGAHATHWHKQAGNSNRSFSTFGRAIGLVPLAQKLELMLGGGMSLATVDYKLKGKPTFTTIRHPVPHALVGTKMKVNDWFAVRVMATLEGTKHKSHDTIKTNHGHALHGGMVAYF